jgi:hypothetical protein
MVLQNGKQRDLLTIKSDAELHSSQAASKNGITNIKIKAANFFLQPF